MSTYPEHVTPTARRVADRFYRKLAHIDIPAGCDFDDLIEITETRTDTTQFTIAAEPERRTG